jgi:hypothetical protein
MKKKKELNGAPVAKKAIAYARVSTKEQEKEGFSTRRSSRLTPLSVPSLPTYLPGIRMERCRSETWPKRRALLASLRG